MNNNFKRSGEKILNFLKIFIFILFFFNFNKTIYADQKLTREEIEIIIHEYIMQNPELIIKSVEKLRQIAEKEEKNKEDYLEKNFNSLANEMDIPWQGNKDAKVVLVEFVDYNCGYCKKSMEAITEILKNNNKIKISFRDYPILSPTSTIAAQAALAANAQNKYFDFHTNLMNYVGNLTEDKIFEIAKESGLNINKLKEHMLDPKITSVLKRNKELAKNLGIRGTPTFLINGKLYAGALDLNRLNFLIDEALLEVTE